MAKLGSVLREVGGFLVFCIVFPALLAPTAGIGALGPVAFWLVYVWMRRTMSAEGPAVQLLMTPEERHLLKTWILFLVVPAYLILLQLWGAFSPSSGWAWIQFLSPMIELLKQLSLGTDPVPEKIRQMGASSELVLAYEHFSIISNWGAILSASLVLALTANAGAKIFRRSADRIPLQVPAASAATAALLATFCYTSREKTLFTVQDGTILLAGKASFLLLYLSPAVVGFLIYVTCMAMLACVIRGVRLR